MPSTRFNSIFPGFIRELEFVLAVGRATEAHCLLREMRLQPHFGQIDQLANVIHPAVFAELRKGAPAASFRGIVRKRSAEFFHILFAVRQDLLRLYAFERKHARVDELRRPEAFKIRWQIESSIGNLVIAGVRFRLGYPLGEEALNKRVEYLNSVLAARVEALAPGWS